MVHVKLPVNLPNDVPFANPALAECILEMDEFHFNKLGQAFLICLETLLCIK